MWPRSPFLMLKGDGNLESEMAKYIVVVYHGLGDASWLKSPAAIAYAESPLVTKKLASARRVGKNSCRLTAVFCRHILPNTRL